MYAFAIEN